MERVRALRFVFSRAGRLLAFLACVAAVPSHAQEAKQKTKGKPRPAAEKLDPSAPATPVTKEDPAVDALLATNPTTPAEMCRVANLLIGLGRGDLAKNFITKVLAAQLDDQKLVELSAASGQGVFPVFAARPEVQPEGRRLAELVFKAVAKFSQDPNRLAELAKQLQDPSPVKRHAALVEIQKAQSAGVVFLVAILADPGRARDFPAIRAALVEMGSAAIGPILGAMESPDPSLVAQAVLTLGAMKTSDKKVYLIAPLCSPDSPPEVRQAAAQAVGREAVSPGQRRQLVELLAKRAQEYFSGKQRVLGTVDGEAEIWHWNTSKHSLVSKRVPEPEAARAMALRLARDAYRLAATDDGYRTLYLTTLLESAAYENGLDKPLPTGGGTPAAEAAKAGIDGLTAVLNEAMRTGHAGATAAAAQLLGEHGSADRLLYAGQTPSPLARALCDPARRVRLAAAEAVLRLRPERPFAGSSHLTDALAFLAISNGTRRVLAGGPTAESARRFAGDLVKEGFVIETATTGRELVGLAIGSPDCEMIFIDTTIDFPPAAIAVQQIRQDCRSSLLPIGLVARDGFLPKAEEMASQERAVLAFPRPNDAAGIRWEASQLAAAAPDAIVPVGARRAQAIRALELLAELTKQPAIYDMRRIEGAGLAALRIPKLDEKAATVLGGIGTPESQQALVDLASRPSATIASRRAAARAFGSNVRTFGVLLTAAEIMRQYDRYNAGATEQPEAQQVLGSILDAIELLAEKAAVKKPAVSRDKPDPSSPKN